MACLHRALWRSSSLDADNIFQTAAAALDLLPVPQEGVEGMTADIGLVTPVDHSAFTGQDLKARADDGNLGRGFTSDYAEVNGVKLHYVEGGQGERTVVLIPGWPQTWFAWRKVMPELGRTFRLIVVDPRGMGDSSRPDGGYDTETAARDISALMAHPGIACYSVIGHDIGMWIAYPLAARNGPAIDRLVVTEALIPGVTPTPPMLLPPEINAGLTQFMFNQLRDLPEMLVAGREAAYLRWLVGHLAFRPDRVAVDEYTAPTPCRVP
jgi:pimeloyl-ACP methyl ester carboxylesterase